MKRSHPQSDEATSGKHEVRAQEVQGGRYPEHVVEVDTSLDSLNVAKTARDLASLERQGNLEYALQASMVRETMGRLGDAIEGLDRSTTIFMMTVAHTSEKESNRVKLAFLLTGTWRQSSSGEQVEPQRVDRQQSSKLEEAPTAPDIGLMLGNAQRVAAESTKARGPLVDEVRDFIKPYIGKRFNSFHDNKALADTIMRMVEDSGLQLYYEGQKVYLTCAERQGSKYGTFEVVVEGTSKKIKQVTTLPALTVGLKESGQAEERAKGKS